MGDRETATATDGLRLRTRTVPRRGEDDEKKKNTKPQRADPDMVPNVMTLPDHHLDPSASEAGAAVGNLGVHSRYSNSDPSRRGGSANGFTPETNRKPSGKVTLPVRGGGGDDAGRKQNATLTPTPTGGRKSPTLEKESNVDKASEEDDDNDDDDDEEDDDGEDTARLLPRAHSSGDADSTVAFDEFYSLLRMLETITQDGTVRDDPENPSGCRPDLRSTYLRRGQDAGFTKLRNLAPLSRNHQSVLAK